jgi:hypothetical protein
MSSNALDTIYTAGYFLQSWEVTQHVKQQTAFFMEPEASLPCSQRPATGPYQEPGEYG